MAVNKGKLERLSGMFEHPQSDGEVVLTGDIAPYNSRTERLAQDVAQWLLNDGVRFVVRRVKGNRGNGPSHALYVEAKKPGPSKSQSIIDECEAAMFEEVKVTLKNQSLST